MRDPFESPLTRWLGTIPDFCYGSVILLLLVHFGVISTGTALIILGVIFVFSRGITRPQELNHSL